jgi:hypothetical protein
MAAPFPSRPKGMWRRTHKRLLNRTFEAETEAEEAFAIRTERLLLRINNLNRRRSNRRRSYWG